MFNNEQTYDEWEADCLNKAKEILTDNQEVNQNQKIETTANLICTPKVRHFWRCIFLWQRKGKNIENTRQNSNYLL